MLRRLLDLLPHDTLMIGGKPYMRRWYVFGYAPEKDIAGTNGAESKPGDKRRGWWWHDHGLGAVRIHEIVASDDSRAYHDHPWNFTAIGLTGSYVEETPSVVAQYSDGRIEWCHRPGPGHQRRFRAPFINRKAASDLHVLRVERGPVWTIFLTRPKVRSWGFAGPFGWMGWRQFDAEYPERDAWTEAAS